MAKTASQSSRIIEYLREREATSFTATELFKELEGRGISSGAVSGLISKMTQAQVLTKTLDKPAVYTMVDRLVNYNYRTSKTSGSTKGRTIHREPITFDRTVNQIIGQLEILKSRPVDLSKVPTKLLLKELAKRTNEIPEQEPLQ